MKKFVYCLLILFVVGVAGTLVSVSATGGFSFDTYKVSDKEVVANKEIKNIEVDLSSTDVEVLPTNDKEITVELDGKVSKKLKKDLKLDVQEKGKTLEVGLKGEEQIKFNIGVLIVDTQVNVFLPEKLYDSIKVESSSGEIRIEEIQANDVSLRASSGDIFSNKVKSASMFKFQTSSGEINATKNEADTFNMKASSGYLVVEDQKSKNSQFHTSSGEIELTNILGDITAEASSGDITIHNEEVAGNIQADTSSGTVAVEFDQEPKSLSIRFKGSSGEGNVELKNVNFEDKSDNKIVGTIGSGKYDLEVNTSSGDFELR